MGKGSRGFYDLFRTPYYWVWVTSGGRVIAEECIPIKKVFRDRFKIKSLKCYFKLPSMTELRIDQIQKKSAILLIYDKQNAIHMSKMSESQLKDLSSMNDEDRTWLERTLKARWGDMEGTIEPDYFVSRRLDPNLLKNWFESNTEQEIISAEKHDIPTWVLLLIALGLVTVMVIAAMYFFGPHPAAVTNATIQAVVTPTIQQLPPGGIFV